MTQEMQIAMFAAFTQTCVEKPAPQLKQMQLVSDTLEFQDIL